MGRMQRREDEYLPFAGLKPVIKLTRFTISGFHLVWNACCFQGASGLYQPGILHPLNRTLPWRGGAQRYNAGVGDSVGTLPGGVA